MLDNNEKVSFKVNKTISFTETDRELYQELLDKKFSQKGFNFNKYVKDLIFADLNSDTKVFTDAERDEISYLIQKALDERKLSFCDVSSEEENEVSCDELDNVSIDSDDEDLLKMEWE